MANDNVNHPTHYQGKIECIEAMLNEFHPLDVAAFCLLNAYKYVWRMGVKENNPEDQDLRKAEWYVNKYNQITGLKDTITIDNIIERVNKYK